MCHKATTVLFEPYDAIPSIMATTMRHLLLLGALLALMAVTPTLAAAGGKTKTKINRLPSACLRDATALCQGATTNSLACLMKLAKAGDVRVSKACSTALPSTLRSAARPSSHISRVEHVRQLLNEGGSIGSTANCGNGPASVTVTTASGAVSAPATNCGSVCCKWSNTATGACCVSNSGVSANCFGGAHLNCV